MEETSKPFEERKSPFNSLRPPRKKSKISELVSQVTGTEEVLTSQSTNYFDSLPYEVIINIFKYLDFTTISKCALLCRRFYFASQDGLLYRKISLRYSMDPRELQSYVSKITVPRKLILKYDVFSTEPIDYSHFNSQVIRLLKKCGEHIISVYIDSCRSDAVLSVLPECRNLKRETTNLQTGTITNVIGNYNTELEKLRIVEQRKVRANGLRSIARCSRLRFLMLGGDGDPEDSLQHLAAGCPRLEKLAVYGWKGITDEKLKPLLQNCTQLNAIELKKLDITIKSCKEALLSLPLLKILHVCTCRMIKDTQLIQLRKEFPGKVITCSRRSSNIKSVNVRLSCNIVLMS